jgi:hypothetical protein
MDYKISKEIPDIYPILQQKFGVSWDKGIVIAYGDTIYAKDPIPDHLLAHELVHLKQQAEYGVEYWWKKYIKEKSFRLIQEIEAYTAQLKFIRNDPDMNAKAKKAMGLWLAKDLSSEIYGDVISYKDAREILNV